MADKRKTVASLPPASPNKCARTFHCPVIQENITLDSLVLENCVAQLTWYHRLRLEPVNRHFALYYKHKKLISLAVQYDGVAGIYTLTCAAISSSSASTRSVTTKLQHKELKSLFPSLFSRFSYIGEIFLKDDWSAYAVSQCVLTAIRNGCRLPEQLSRLKYIFQSSTGGYDTSLIEQFAATLKRLTIVHYPDKPCFFEHSDIWKQIALCTSLKTLEFAPEKEGSFDFLNNLLDMQTCLKTLKIRHFRWSTTILEFPLTWITQAFRENENVRKLLLSAPYSQTIIDVVASPWFRRIAARLRCMGMKFREVPENYFIPLIELARVLPENGHLMAFHSLTMNSFVDQETIKVLSFWLEVSEASKRTVKVRLIYLSILVTRINRCIAEMKSGAQYVDLIVERQKNRTVLRHKNAMLIVSLANKWDILSGKTALTEW